MTETILGNVVVPAVWDEYVRIATTQKSELLRSGAIVQEPRLSALMAQGGTSVNVPFWNDLASTTPNRSLGTTATAAAVNNMTAATQVALPIEANNTWGAVDFAATVAGSDPLQVALDRVSTYWNNRKQDTFISIIEGIFADNAAAPGGTEHVQNDMTFSLAAAFNESTTRITTEAVLDAIGTMGDSQNELALMMVHPVVYTRLRKLQLIDFLTDATNGTRMPVYQDMQLIVDARMPFLNNNPNIDYQTWFFGRGAVLEGARTPKNPIKQDRDELAYNGAGLDKITSRIGFCYHPVGNSVTNLGATIVEGNAAANTVLDDATSWVRVFPERNQIKIARLITTESP